VCVYVYRPNADWYTRTPCAAHDGNESLQKWPMSMELVLHIVGSNVFMTWRGEGVICSMGYFLSEKTSLNQVKKSDQTYFLLKWWVLVECFEIKMYTYFGCYLNFINILADPVHFVARQKCQLYNVIQTLFNSFI